MSIEMITTLIGVVSILLALAGGFGWMVHRMDTRIDAVRTDFDARFDRLDARVDRMSDELVEVKIAIARVEGPPRHLLPAR